MKYISSFARTSFALVALMLHAPAAAQEFRHWKIQSCVDSDAEISVFAHEISHALGLTKATANDHHDMGTAPNNLKPLMYSVVEGTCRWLRQEDWRHANDVAKDVFTAP